MGSAKARGPTRTPRLLLVILFGVKKFIFRSKVVPYPGFGAWYFAYVDDKQSKKLKELPRKSKRGFGSIKVRAKIGKQIWDTSLFPTKEGPYLLAIKKSVRFEEGIDAGDTVNVTVGSTLMYDTNVFRLSSLVPGSFIVEVYRVVEVQVVDLGQGIELAQPGGSQSARKRLGGFGKDNQMEAVDLAQSIFNKELMPGVRRHELANAEADSHGYARRK